VREEWWHQTRRVLQLRSPRRFEVVAQTCRSNSGITPIPSMTESKALDSDTVGTDLSSDLDVSVLGTAPQTLGRMITTASCRHCMGAGCHLGVTSQAVI